MFGAVGWMMMLLAPAPAPGQNYTLRCDVGPIERSFAGHKSRVYSCSDGESLIIQSADTSSGTEFTYSILVQGGRPSVGGNGSGDGEIVAGVYQELRRMTPRQVAALVAATKARQ